MDDFEKTFNQMNVRMPIDTSRSEVKKVEAIKLGYRQTSAGNVVSFRLHPDDDTRAIADLALGSRVMLAVAEIVG